MKMLGAVVLIGLILHSNAELEASNQRDCADILANTLSYTPPSGSYHLLVGEGHRSVWVDCDMTTDGGGWTVIQRRTSPSVDFYRNWTQYEEGFGDVREDHWLGLTYIHSITVGRRYVLRVEFSDWAGLTHYAEYDDFRVADSGFNYKLESLGEFSGDCGDSLKPHHLGQPFSTRDRDNDASLKNCAQELHGAWWYGSCHESNLNGEYKSEGDHSSIEGISWKSCEGFNYSFKTSFMKIRPYLF